MNSDLEYVLCEWRALLCIALVELPSTSLTVAARKSTCSSYVSGGTKDLAECPC